jgi:hypothetical protein
LWLAGLDSLETHAELQPATSRPLLNLLRVCRPRTWLLERGWQLAGSVGTRDVPGSI